MSKTPSDSELISTDLIRQLADLLSETSLTEIEVERAGVRLRIARQVTVAPTLQTQTVPLSAPPVQAPTPSPSVSEAPAATSDHPGIVRSPMVGTVYLAASPDAAPFVNEGDTVQEGDTILIIEAMKTMNHIKAPRGGRVSRLLVQNEQPVEFDEPLFIIE